MTALSMREVRLADVQREIPELEAAMAVYRRLSDGGTGTPVAAPRATPSPHRRKPAKVSTPKVSRPRRASGPPSFQEFARSQLDSFSDEPVGPPPAPRAALA